MSFANKTIVLTGVIVWNWAIAAISLAQQGASLVLGARNRCFRRNGCCLRETGRKGDRSSNGCDSTRTMSAVDRAGDHSLWAN